MDSNYLNILLTFLAKNPNLNVLNLSKGTVIVDNAEGIAEFL